MVSILFLTTGINLTISNSHKIYNGEYTKTIATISEKKCITTKSIIDKQDTTSCEVFIDYKVNLEEYKNIKLNYNDHSLKKGKKIEIYYNKNNPKEIITIKNSISGIFISLFGLILLFINFLIIKENKKQKGDE